MRAATAGPGARCGRGHWFTFTTSGFDPEIPEAGGHDAVHRRGAGAGENLDESRMRALVESIRSGQGPVVGEPLTPGGSTSAAQPGAGAGGAGFRSSARRTCAAEKGRRSHHRTDTAAEATMKSFIAPNPEPGKTFAMLQRGTPEPLGGDDHGVVSVTSRPTTGLERSSCWHACRGPRVFPSLSPGPRLEEMDLDASLRRETGWMPLRRDGDIPTYPAYGHAKRWRTSRSCDQPAATSSPPSTSIAREKSVTGTVERVTPFDRGARGRVRPGASTGRTDLVQSSYHA